MAISRCLSQNLPYKVRVFEEISLQVRKVLLYEIAPAIPTRDWVVLHVLTMS